MILSHHACTHIDLNVHDVNKRRLWKFIHGEQAIFLMSDATDDDLDQDTEIFIRYIFCGRDLFANDIAETQIAGLQKSMKLNEIAKMICTDNKIPPKETIELYSSHGYPLQNNELTGEGISSINLV